MTTEKEPDGNDVFHLKGEARLVAEHVLKAMTLLNDGAQPYTGGCRTFYSPAEWRQCGGGYGLKLALIICHDGGDVATFFNPNYECYKRMEAIQEALSHVGYRAEQCANWYTAIYRD